MFFFFWFVELPLFVSTHVLLFIGLSQPASAKGFKTLLKPGISDLVNVAKTVCDVATSLNIVGPALGENLRHDGTKG